MLSAFKFELDKSSWLPGWLGCPSSPGGPVGLGGPQGPWELALVSWGCNCSTAEWIASFIYKLIIAVITYIWASEKGAVCLLLVFYWDESTVGVLWWDEDILLGVYTQPIRETEEESWALINKLERSRLSSDADSCAGLSRVDGVVIVSLSVLSVLESWSWYVMKDGLV